MTLPKRFRPLVLVTAAASAMLLTGYTVDPTYDLIAWQYHGTLTGTNRHAYDLTNGRPTVSQYSRTLPSNLPAMPSDLVSRVRYTLPEGKDIRQNAQGITPDSDDKSNIILSEDGDIWVTFVTEGAGYRNSVGYFTYDPNSPPRTPRDVQEKIIFADASMSSPLDPAGTQYQNTVHLGRFTRGQAIGFMIVSDGFKSNARSHQGTKVNGVKENANRKWIFYTLRHLNPEAAGPQNLNAHTVMLSDLNGASDGYRRLVIGFEDINREVGGDHDFNDVVLAIHVTPGRAISNLGSLPSLVSVSDPDTDGDGVKDSLDEFPNDPTRAFSRYYPDRNTWGTLAYEDNWPQRGDFDLNDVVVRYRTREIMNARRDVVSLELDHQVMARGGTYDMGFAVRLPGVPASAVRQATLSRNGQTAQPLAIETGQTEASYVVMRSSLGDLANGGGGASCWFANTQSPCNAVNSVSYRSVIDLVTPLASSRFASPYDPFIFRANRRTHEVHLPGRQPTPLADAALFGQGDDRTVPGTSFTYMDSARRPWAMDIPAEWRHPEETRDIGWAYPKVTDWAQSSGTTSRDWYTAPVLRHLYTKP